MSLRSLWETRCLPGLIERACRSGAILEERRRWVSRASGEVLEVGVGSGLNLGVYDPARVTSLVGLDPSLELIERARVRAQASPLAVELLAAAGERLPFDGGRFDTVVATYTLCSVQSPPDVLAEIRRVLRPGGKLVFIEHGAAPDAGLRRWQRRLTPLWSRISGNCHLDRDVRSDLAAASYELDEVEAAYSEGIRLTSFTTAGIATPR